MSLTSSLFAGVSGLNSQSQVLAAVGNNIANISTVGFKSNNTAFSSLVTGGANLTGSGTLAANLNTISQQGLIESTGISTDVAISGSGFFVVSDLAAGDNKQFLYSRSGSFRQDELGFFRNSSGFILQAYPLDSEGRLPGELGNTNTTSSQLLESLQSVNTRDINGLAFATTTIALGLNLDAGESVLTGSGDTGTFGDVSTNDDSTNQGIGANDIIVPQDTQSTLTSGDTLTITLGNGTDFDFVYGGFSEGNDITSGSGFFGATTATTAFSTGASLTAGDSFTITTASTGTNTFTFQTSGIQASLGTFNTLNTMAAAIDNVQGLTARVSEGRLYVASLDSQELVTIADVDSGEIASTVGISTIAASALNRFNSLENLAGLINEENGISATLVSAAIDSSITITVDDPLSTIQFSDDGSNTGSILTELNISSTAFDPIYDSTGANGSNMASGDISPAFSRNIRVFDSLGTGHDLLISFAKADDNTWLVELFAADESDVVVTNDDGQLAAGTVIFNGDGTLNNISAGLVNAIEVVWTNDAEPSSITLDLGTAGPVAGDNVDNPGLSDGLSQFDGAFTVQFADQNGAGSGLLSSVEINEQGFIVANFSNGESRNIFRIPLATFPNPDGLNPLSGNSFEQSDASGEFTLNVVGDAAVGTISPAALEQANTELADELTKLIIAQRAFQSNTRVVTTADELLEELNRI